MLAKLLDKYGINDDDDEEEKDKEGAIPVFKLIKIMSLHDPQFNNKLKGINVSAEEAKKNAE